MKKNFFCHLIFLFLSFLGVVLGEEHVGDVRFYWKIVFAGPRKEILMGNGHSWESVVGRRLFFFFFFYKCLVFVSLKCFLKRKNFISPGPKGRVRLILNTAALGPESDFLQGKYFLKKVS